MITASKPKISRAGPIAGSKLVRTARNTPATATIASDSAIASAEDVAVVEAHQLRHRLVVGGGAERAAERGAVEQQLQAGDHRDRDDELQQRQHADPDALGDLEARDLDAAGLEAAAVGGEQLQQRVLDDDREPERHQQRRQQVVAERAVEQRRVAARSRSPP